ncbi:undecaprenyl/decaprenyl-phosphate alpha-N-acetylglucosaminyl 1-phosphate transferase [Candidatus Woesebacteria bacterium]|nr:undecaprenyl/decaprenyl-phosphate alpha-N-acetylglucosaminyl 1-phosphate transferase [Candidatus Woesebacteria bacterium]
MSTIFFALLFSTVLGLIATPLVILFAKRFRLVDNPILRYHPANTHEGIIPRAGGLALLIPFVISTLIFVDVSQIVVGILLGAILIVLMGIVDDILDVSPIVRLFTIFGIVSLVILFGLGVPYISNPFGGVIHLDQFKFTYELFGQQREFLVLSNLFALIWISAIMNFVNWSSGVDGQLPGFTAISCIFLGLIALRFSSHEISSYSVALLSFIAAGSCLGFLPWHFYPQKIMPGYSGGALAGFFLGVLSILSWGKIGTMALVLAIPLVDAFYIIIRRLSSGKSPLRGDAGHFHHRLLEAGWGKRRISVFYIIVSALFGVCALFLESTEKLLAFMIVGVLLAVFIVTLNTVKKR